MKFLSPAVEKKLYSVAALAMFCALLPAAAKALLINEVSMYGTTDQGGNDWVEIYVTTGGNYGNYRLYEAGTAVKTFPAAFNPATGDYILIHEEAGTDEDDTTGKGANGFWDLYGAGDFTGTDQIISVRNSAGTVWLDAVGWSNKDGDASSTLVTSYNDMKNAGMWTDGPATFIDGTNDAEVQNALVTSVAAGSSIGRGATSTDTNSKADWTKQTAPTPGAVNAAPVAGGAGNISGLITEVAPSETNDWIEIYITADCDVSGAQIYEKSTLVVTLPDISAKKGEFIVVRCKSAATSETGASLTAGDTNRNGYWDVYTAYAGLTGTDSVLSLRRGNGSYVDAVPYSNRDGTTFSPKTDYDALVENNQWTPASTVDWGSSDYENNSANWKGGGSGKSVARKKTIANDPQDTNIESDWELKTRQTPGYGYGGETLTTEKILEVKDPNPFSPHAGQEANLSYSVPRESIKTLRIYDIRGREVKRLIDQDRNLVEGGMLTAVGTGFAVWNGKNEAGAILPVGMYIAVMEAYDSTTKVTQKGAATVIVGRQF